MPFQRVREHPDEEGYAPATPKCQRRLQKLSVAAEGTLPSPPATLRRSKRAALRAGTPATSKHSLAPSTTYSTSMPHVSAGKHRLGLTAKILPERPTTPPPAKDPSHSGGGQPNLAPSPMQDAPIWRGECEIHTGTAGAAGIGVLHETQVASGLSILEAEGVDGLGCSFRDIEEYVEGLFQYTSLPDWP
ncbi:hypothetical protein B0H16DRAFT_1470624 [Mycena metata]|uniref:Uncharacterized protein n=1 Tax=Mycena metata TaxID=1033252 RepID=A0AAD7HTW7_9AGAR|nr:hypothetical protein B0H16DRAFT_1470624 [Mycena metata]